MSPKLSIIIPCYNCEKTLREAVDSCYVQGFSENEFEIVMVDDGSTDETRELMKRLAEEHANLHLFFHEKNKGGGAARNTAVANSKSEVIFCLDSDDLLPPNTMDKMLNYLHKKQCDGVGFNYFLNFNGTNVNDINHIITMSYVGERIPFDSLLQEENQMCALYHVFMFTKNSFNKAGGYPTHHGFDTQGFAWRFLTAGLHAETCPNTKYLQRVNFHKSYYLREYNDGKVNLNWKMIFIEHFYLFNKETKKFILDYDISDFTKNIYTQLKKRQKVFRDDYCNFIGSNYRHTVAEIKVKNKLIKVNSLSGIYLRIKNRLHL